MSEIISDLRLISDKTAAMPAMNYKQLTIKAGL